MNNNNNSDNDDYDIQVSLLLARWVPLAAQAVCLAGELPGCGLCRQHPLANTDKASNSMWCRYMVCNAVQRDIVQ